MEARTHATHYPTWFHFFLIASSCIFGGLAGGFYALADTNEAWGIKAALLICLVLATVCLWGSSLVEPKNTKEVGQ